MKRLSEKEEALLKTIWALKKAFAKDVLEELPKPKPHINTVATTLRRMADKGFLRIEIVGGMHRYSSAISKKEYSTRFVKPLLKGIFGNSIKNVVAFFAEQEDISVEELKEIVKMIENKNK